MELPLSRFSSFGLGHFYTSLLCASRHQSLPPLEDNAISLHTENKEHHHMYRAVPLRLNAHDTHLTCLQNYRHITTAVDTTQHKTQDHHHYSADVHGAMTGRNGLRQTR